MTREEIIEAIQNDDMMPFLQDWEARDVVDFVLKNYRPSPRSDLDEAANRQAALEKPYKWEEEKDGSFGVTPLFVMSNVRSAFKACAEWMAGQGASFNTKVGWIDGPTILDWPDDILDKFEMGDEVIVQIRKNNPAKA